MGGGALPPVPSLATSNLRSNVATSGFRPCFSWRCSGHPRIFVGIVVESREDAELLSFVDNNMSWPARR